MIGAGFQGHVDDITAIVPIGVCFPFAGYSAPFGYLIADGSAVSRTGVTQRLFETLCPSAPVSISIASPAVFSATAHGLVVGDRIQITTTGVLPTGLSTNTYYYVTSVTANTFEVSAKRGGTPITTTVGQSGSHTFIKVNYGKGDGSTTFNLPDLRSRMPIGLGGSTFAFDILPADVNTGTDVITVDKNSLLYTGQRVVLTTTGSPPAGLTAGNTYYVIRINDTTIKLAVGPGEATNGTGVDITSAGTGIHTLTGSLVSRTVAGELVGEESHTLTKAEMPSHNHPKSYNTGGSGSSASENAAVAGTSSASYSSKANTPADFPTANGEGGSEGHLNIPPSVVMNYIIRYIVYT